MKRLVLTGLLGCLGLIGFAQSKFSLGVVGGASHSYVSTYENNRFNPCWNAGIRAVYGPGEHWAMSMDVLYSREGYYQNRLRGGTTFSNLDYIRVTDRATYFFRPYTVNFRPKVSLGPSVGFLVDQESPNGEEARPVDFGMQGSLGFNVRLVKEVWLNFDAAYYQGLVDVYKRPAGGHDLNGRMGVDLGVTFGF